MKYTITMLAVLLLFGCATKKKLLEINHLDKTQSEQTDIRDETKQTEKKTTASEIETAFKGETDIEVIFTKYDTSKPINIATGRPPIESETKATKHSKASKDTKGLASSSVEASKIETHQDSTKSTFSEKIETTRDEKIKNSLPFYVYIIGVGILMVLICGAWLWLKRWWR